MTAGRRLLVALMLASASTPAAAQADPPLPVIREIVFEGNEITEPVTMEREMVVAVGDAADPKKIERSRQGIQDLGLFREVKVRQQDVEGGVRLVFTLREKWYVIPIPRLEANSDGDTGYGLQLRWANLWGLNHRWEMLAVQRDFKRQDKDGSTNFSTNYDIPFIGSSRNALNLSATYNDQDSTTDDGIDFRERTERLGFVLSRSLNEGPRSQGWKVGAGLSWNRQTATGEDAPESDGMATSPALQISYRKLHDHLYSETGRIFSTSVGFAVDDVLSDYSYFSHFSRYINEIAVGKTEHQTLRMSAEIGGLYGGPPASEPDAFEFGGSTKLRGYDRERIQGDFAYYGAVDYLRPLHWNWLRLLSTFEVGSALDSLDDPNGKLLYASVGLGVTVRVTWLVNVEFETGIAYPLIDGNGQGIRFFARSL